MSIESYGKYQLLEKLAMGGMAQIYLARQRGPEGFEKEVVIKRILPHLAENREFVQMFLDEARIAARLDHPNIVQIYDLGAQDDSFFIAMEYIHGEDLRRVWKRAERGGELIPVPLVCRIMIEACAGLDHAHKKLDANGKPLNIVHRDISPQNILLTFEGRVKVVDFGIAKAADQATVTRSGVLKGKYSYMSPEQAAGQKVDCRSDIFALGVVLYELLTGVRLFKRANDMATLQAVAACDVQPPSELDPRVPKDLDPIVMKALAREPGDRYAEALQLQLALEGWLLAHQHPSSTAHVAAFMQELYAERLSEATLPGDVLVDESGSLSPPGSGKASDKQSRSSRSSRSERSNPSERKEQEPRRTVDIRRAPEPEVPRPASSEKPAPRPSRSRQPAVAVAESSEQAPPELSNRLAWVGVGAGVLVGLLLVGGWWALRSEPAPEPAPVAVRPATEPKAPEPSQPAPVRQEPPREEPKPSVAEPVQVTPKTAPAQAAPSAPPKEEPRPEPARPTPALVERPSPSETRLGSVVFVTSIDDWVQVTCGGKDLGTFPGPPVQLAAGRYECRFSNPDRGFVRAQRVEVKAGTQTRVPVKF